MTLLLLALAAAPECIASEATIDSALGRDEGIDFCIGHDCWRFDGKTQTLSPGAPTPPTAMPSEVQSDGGQVCALGACKHVARKDFVYSDALQVRPTRAGTSFALWRAE